MVKFSLIRTRTSTTHIVMSSPPSSCQLSLGDPFGKAGARRCDQVNTTIDARVQGSTRNIRRRGSDHRAGHVGPVVDHHLKKANSCERDDEHSLRSVQRLDHKRSEVGVMQLGLREEDCRLY